MKIGIDARFFGPIGKGLGRYTQRLIENLEKIDKENKYVIFLRKENWSNYQPRNPNFKKVLAPWRWYTILEQIYMPRLIKSHDVGLMHFPHFNVPLFYKGSFVVTIHDLVLEHFPTQRATTLSPLFYKIKRVGYKIVIRAALKRARQILVPSEYTKEEIIKYFGLEPTRIKVTYEGCGKSDFPYYNVGSLTSEIPKKYGIIKPYILYVGNAYPHKNLERLILAFQKLSKAYQLDLRLVLVGENDYFYKRLKDTVLKLGIKNIILAGFVRDEDLNSLYKNALFYIFPSLCEGFGLPPLEAMACGLPVASSNKTCLPEILGDAAYYFNPDSVDDIARAIEKVAIDEDLRKKLIVKGFEQIKKYSWKRMAEETLKTYRRTLNLKS